MGRAQTLRKAAEENATPVNAYQATDSDLPEILQPQNDSGANLTRIPPQPTALVRSSESQIVRPILTPEEATAEWKNYIETCKAVLEPSDYIYYACAKKPDGYDVKPQAFRTRDGAEGQLEIWKKQNFRELMVRETKKRSAWDKLARFYGISTPIESQALCSTAEIIQVGTFIIEKLAGDSFTVVKYQDAETLTLKKVNVLLRVVAPNGRTILGDGSCSVSERKSGAEGFAHVDHDVFSTAFTRAMNRGISRCIGTGEVSAEEFGDTTTQPAEAATVASAPARDTAALVTVRPDSPPSPQQAAPQPAAAPSMPPRASIPDLRKEAKVEAASPQTAPPASGNGQAQSASPDAYQPLPEAASGRDKITAMEKYCFGASPCDNRAIRYLPLAVGVPSALPGPYAIEQNGKWNPKKWNEVMASITDRSARFEFMQQQLSIMGREHFVPWAEAIVAAARGRGVFGK